MSFIRFVGDVHSDYDHYLYLIQDAPYSFQVGDLGFNYEYLRRSKMDWNKHKAIAGNHDNYGTEYVDHFKQQPFFLGDFGTHKIENLDIFYVRGAWSIDQEWRKRQKFTCWWPTEELSVEQLQAAIDLYATLKPEVVVTHEAPIDIVPNVTDPLFPLRFGFGPGTIKTRTSLALQAMWELHQPKYWFFGHYHFAWNEVVNNTHFFCLDMLKTYDQKGHYYDLYC